MNTELNETISAQKIAQNIFTQLGGIGNLLAMVGAHNFVRFSNGVQFSIKGCRKINKIRITLDPDDTYTFEFWKITNHGLDAELVKSVDMVYADALIDIFEMTTGLYLKF